ncbi:MAG: recombination-associated protein RdgC [Deltaproteobacteria bacterium]|nr:recombination-associated protein RdgC [Deltaproteobacteria bacterium]MBW2068722.1 recombination-associated protein RdgC [Deltaproteobacteria bacterium]
MGLKSGSVNVTFFYVPEPLTEDFWNFIHEKLTEGRFRPCSNDDVSCHGFTTWEDIFSVDFEDLGYRKGEYLAFSFRLDKKKVPPMVVKQHLKEEEKRFFEEKKRPPSKKEKQFLRETVEKKLLKKAFSCPMGFEIVWNPMNHEMMAGTTSQGLLEAYLEHFERTFRLYPIPLYHLQWAIYMDGIPKSLKDSISQMINPSSPSAIKEGRFIGYDFLLWLWYISEKGENAVDIHDNKKAFINLGDKLVLTDPKEGKERTVCTTPSHRLEEARLALAKGKQLDEAQWVVSVDDRDYSFLLDASLWTLRNLKLPMTDKKYDPNDPDGYFFERIFLLEELRQVLTEFYGKFLRLRFDSAWGTDVMPHISEWVNLIQRV